MRGMTILLAFSSATQTAAAPASPSAPGTDDLAAPAVSPRPARHRFQFPIPTTQPFYNWYIYMGNGTGLSHAFSFQKRTFFRAPHIKESGQ